MKKAIIFDFNGVIITDEHIQREAFRRVVEKYGINLDANKYVELCLGRTSRACMQRIYEDFNLEISDVEQDLQEKRIIYDDLIKNNLCPAPGLIDFIHQVCEDYRLAIASGGNKSMIENILNALEIKKHFEVIVSSEDSEFSKPHPDPYCRAAKQLGISPQECIVIEDSETGIKAAKNAGMKCIALTTTRKKEDLREADLVVSSFFELNEEKLAAI